MPSAAARAPTAPPGRARRRGIELGRGHPQVVDAGPVEALGEIADRASPPSRTSARMAATAATGSAPAGFWAGEAGPLGRVAEVTPSQVQPVQHNGTVPGAPVDPEAANSTGLACDTRPMTTSRAELGSTLTQLRELADRVSRAGDDLNESPTEDAASALYEADRAAGRGALGRAGGRAPLTG